MAQLLAPLQLVLAQLQPSSSTGSESVPVNNESVPHPDERPVDPAPKLSKQQMKLLGSVRQTIQVIDKQMAGAKIQLKPQRVEQEKVVECLVVCKWGGVLTHMGEEQAKIYVPNFWDEMLRPSVPPPPSVTDDPVPDVSPPISPSRSPTLSRIPVSPFRSKPATEHIYRSNSAFAQALAQASMPTPSGSASDISLGLPVPTASAESAPPLSPQLSPSLPSPSLPLDPIVEVKERKATDADADEGDEDDNPVVDNEDQLALTGYSDPTYRAARLAFLRGIKVRNQL